MAEIKPQVYKDPRPASYFQGFHERSRSRGADWVYDVCRIILTPPTLLIYRSRAIGTENVPQTGPVILAPNHFSQWDHFFAAVFLRRKVRFMAKSQLFKPPFLTFILSHGGAFPIRRGHRDEEAFKTAHAILGNDECMLIYAEGGRSRSGGLGEPRPGIGRLALESGVPVVPMAIHGSSKVRNWKRLQFPKVTVRYGDPIIWDKVEDPTREQQQAVADEILTEIRALYAELDAEGRAGVVRRVRELRRAERAGRKKTAPA